MPYNCKLFVLRIVLWSYNCLLRICHERVDLSPRQETATHMLWMQSIFQKDTWPPSTWKYIDGGLAKYCRTDVDMQILSLLECEYKRGKGSVWDNFCFSDV